MLFFDIFAFLLVVVIEIFLNYRKQGTFADGEKK